MYSLCGAPFESELTALMIASGEGHLTVAKMLVGCGAKIEVRDEVSST